MSPHYVDLSHFKLIKVIGVGTQAVIWLVEKRKTQAQIDKELAALRENNKEMTVDKEFYALKVMNKRRLF